MRGIIVLLVIALVAIPFPINVQAPDNIDVIIRPDSVDSLINQQDSLFQTKGCDISESFGCVNDTSPDGNGTYVYSAGANATNIISAGFSFSTSACELTLLCDPRNYTIESVRFTWVARKNTSADPDEFTIGVTSGNTEDPNQMLCVNTTITNVLTQAFVSRDFVLMNCNGTSWDIDEIADGNKPVEFWFFWDIPKNGNITITQVYETFHLRFRFIRFAYDFFPVIVFIAGMVAILGLGLWVRNWRRHH